MNRAHLILISLITLIALIIAGIVIFSVYNAQPSQSPADLNCSQLLFSGENKPSILFFSSKEDTVKYSEYLDTIEPFKSNRGSFNINYINSYQPNCELYQNVALYCYSRDLIKKASSCKSDYIVVLQSKPSQIRSSTYMNVISINTALPLSVFPHEFAHAFAFLADEYVPATLPKGSENCGSSCSNFESSCFQGCSKSEYYRSINSGIMRTLSSSVYGPFDEALISKKLSPNNNYLTGNAILEKNECSSKNYYLLELQNSNGALVLINKTVESGCSSSSGSGNYYYEIFKNNEIADINSFNPQLIFTDSTDSGEVFNSQEKIYIRLDALDFDKMKILDSDKNTIGELNLKDVGAQTCRIS